MKSSMLLIMLFVPFLVFAENYSGLDSKQMQNMMQKAQDMQNCMQNVDQAEMQALEKQGKKMQAEVKKLCVAGKRDEALNVAIEYSQKMAQSAAIEEMKKCGEMMQEIMPDLSRFSKEQSTDNSDGHLCDNWE